MKVLFIGGTGIISSACSRLAIEKGIDLYHLNRGISKSKRMVEGVKTLQADINKTEECLAVLGNQHFDAVVNWIVFEPEQIQRDIDLFSSRCDQYVFISSASIYETPPSKMPVTEETPLYNPVWKYSQNKIACEDLLRKAGKEKGFPYTIVRPSHTYDKTLVPLEGGYTVLDRIKRGKEIVIHGDGSSLWTLTNHRDFAKGLVGLLGKRKALGEAYHICSDEWLSWDNIAKILAMNLGVEAKIVHIPSEVIARYNEKVGCSLLGDKTHSMIFDNRKIKELVPEFICTIPFEQGAGEIVEWYEADPSRQICDEETNRWMDKIIKDYKIAE